MEKRQVICDTDVLIDLFDLKRKRHAETLTIINQIGRDNVIISAVSKMEILAGARNKEYLSQLDKRLADFQLALINEEVTETAIELILKYHLSHGLELPDSLIASTVLCSGLELYTYNTKDYKFIAGLKLYK